jgi:hypothetical protein
MMSILPGVAMPQWWICVIFFVTDAQRASSRWGRAQGFPVASGKLRVCYGKWRIKIDDLTIKHCDVE